MALRVTQGFLNAILTSGFDTIFNGGTLELRSGVGPIFSGGSGAYSPATGILLYSKVLPADAFSAPVAGVSSKLGNWDGTGLAVGDIGHFRLKTASDTNASSETQVRLDGAVTLTSGSGDLTVNSLAAAPNLPVAITSLTFRLLVA